MADRRAAIETSGWGSPFSFVQLRNPSFWLYLILVVWGAVAMWHQMSKVSLEITTIVGTVVTLALYGLVLALVFRNVDRYDGQPFKLLAVGFIWGGVAATFGMAINANEALADIYGKLFGHAFVIDWSAALTAPLVEETAKAAGFLLLLGLAPGRIRSACDALLVGAFIGLGFELFEDLIYMFNAAAGTSGSDQVQAAIQMIVVRSYTGFFTHALFTALFSAGIIYLVGTPALKRNRGRGIGLIAAAVLAHAVWDGAGAIGDGGPVTVVAMFAAAIGGILVLVFAFRRAAPQERLWMQDVLKPEASSGAVTEEEMAAAAGTYKQKRAFVKFPDGKRRRRGRRDRRRLLRMCRKLTQELAKSQGADTPKVEHARSEIARLRS